MAVTVEDSEGDIVADDDEVAELVEVALAAGVLVTTGLCVTVNAGLRLAVCDDELVEMEDAEFVWVPELETAAVTLAVRDRVGAAELVPEGDTGGVDDTDAAAVEEAVLGAEVDALGGGVPDADVVGVGELLTVYDEELDFVREDVRVPLDVSDTLADELAVELIERVGEAVTVLEVEPADVWVLDVVPWGLPVTDAEPDEVKVTDAVLVDAAVAEGVGTGVSVGEAVLLGLTVDDAVIEGDMDLVAHSSPVLKLTPQTPGRDIVSRYVQSN